MGRAGLPQLLIVHRERAEPAGDHDRGQCHGRTAELVDITVRVVALAELLVLLVLQLLQLVLLVLLLLLLLLLV